MGNPTTARMRVGGQFTPWMVQEFDKLMDENRGEEQPESVMDCVGEHVEIFDPMANWGEFPPLQEFCQKHGLSYNVEVEQDWRGPEYWMVYRPGWNSAKQYDPYPAIGLDELEKLATIPKKMIELIRERRRRNPEVPDLPVVEIDESQSIIEHLEFDATVFENDLRMCPFCGVEHEVPLPKAIWRLSGTPPHASVRLRCKQCQSEWSAMLKPYSIQPIKGARVVRDVRSKKKARTHGNQTNDSSD